MNTIIAYKWHKPIGKYIVHKVIANGRDRSNADFGNTRYITSVSVGLSNVDNLPDDYTYSDIPEFIFEYSRKSNTYNLKTKNRHKAWYTNEKRDDAKALAMTIVRLLSDGVPASAFGGPEYISDR